jgi:ATP/maltotriose-dependent transcriptional regulator MalT
VANRLVGRIRLPVEEELSSRELEVLGLVANGLSNSDIANRLHISQATVKSHLIHIFGKLGVSDRTAAVTVALQRGLIRLDS